MKKAFYLLFVLSITLGLVSCGSDDDNDSVSLKGEWVYKQTIDNAKITQTLNFSGNKCTVYTNVEREGGNENTQIIYKYEYSAPNIKFYTNDTNEYIASGITKDDTIEFYDKDNNKTVYRKK